MKYFLRSIIYQVCLFFLFNLLGSRSAAQSISGVVNLYAKVTYVSQPSVALAKVVVTSNVFAANDKVMLIQMKGATIDTTNSSTFGTISSLNSAGRYEFGIVAYVNGDTVALKGPICNTYSVPDSVQLIKIAVYSTPVTVTSTLTCAPWAGGVGGVLVIDAADSLTLNADIDVSSKGFLGGNVFGVIFNCSASDYCTPNLGTSSADGLKGEGIAQYIPGKECGRAPSANGGGGAGAGNAAAGAGANYGAGGGGGAQYDGCGPQATNALYYGMGGYSTGATAGRLFMGGGGGGPQHDNGYLVYNGGNGGGIILIRAKSINGNNFTIRSDGDSIRQTHDEGTSGAGAGGTIYINCPSYYTNVHLEATGGTGGSVYNTAFPTNCHPPSGGGGGGVVWFSTSSIPAAAAVNVAGGAPGLVLRPSSPCYNTSDYATAGTNGGILFSLPNPFLYPQRSLRDTIVCTAFSITLALDSGYQSYLWSTGGTNDTITVSQHGTYTVQATTPLGCIIFDTAIIRSDSLGLPKDTIICNSTTFTLSPTPAGNFTSYLWQDGSTGSTYSVVSTGEYKVTVNTVLGCQLSDSVHVTALTKPSLKDTLVCNNNSPASISLPRGYRYYQWSTGGTDSSIIVTHAGTYTVHAITSYGCIVDDTAQVANDVFYLGRDTSLCYGKTLLLVPSPASDIVSYRWQDYSTAPTFNVTQKGLYYVTVKTVHNCILSDSMKVAYYPQIYSHITADSAACPGTTIPISSLETFNAYNWSTGATTKSINGGAGVYILQVTTTTGCIGYDTAVVAAFPMPAPYIGPDTAICFNLYDTLTLTPGLFKSYHWQDSSYAGRYVVTRPGAYTVTVTDSNGCQATVSRQVANAGCPDPFYVPNAFTPNGDNLNDIFRLRAKDLTGLKDFDLKVFNRWGELVFHTFNIDEGWDGTYKHMPAEMGNYFWSVTFTTLNAKTLQPVTTSVKGDVVLIR